MFAIHNPLLLVNSQAYKTDRSRREKPTAPAGEAAGPLAFLGLAPRGSSSREEEGAGSREGEPQEEDEDEEEETEQMKAEKMKEKPQKTKPRKVAAGTVNCEVPGKLSLYLGSHREGGGGEKGDGREEEGREENTSLHPPPPV